MIFDWASFYQGFIFCLGISLAVGVQNVFIMRQGINDCHLTFVIWTCIFFDALMIILGSLGVGHWLSVIPMAQFVMAIAGEIFILSYALRSLYRAFAKNIDQFFIRPAENTSRKKLFITCFVICFLNPHAIIDTLVLIAGFVSQYESWSDQVNFTVGAIFAVILWLHVIGYGARFARQLLSKELFRRLFDLLISLIMFWVAYQLYIEYIQVNIVS